MNINSNQKRKPAYLLVLFTLVSLFIFSSCGEEGDEPVKLDYSTLMAGTYKGTITSGPQVEFASEATLSRGSTNDEINFSEIIKRVGKPDSTTTFKIELIDLNSANGIALRIPQQTVQGAQIVGRALREDDSRGTQGFFFYKNEEGEIINEITFLVSGNGGVYYYTYAKVE